MHDKMNFDGGFSLEEVTDIYKELQYIVNETMMRIELTFIKKRTNILIQNKILLQH